MFGIFDWISNAFDRAVFDRDCIITAVNFPGPNVFTAGEAAKMMTTFTKDMESSKQIGRLLLGIHPHIRGLHGKPKTNESLQATLDHFVQHFIPNKEYLPKGYNFFAGNSSSKSILVALLRSNPFFGSALKAVKLESGEVEYHVKSYDQIDRTWFARFSDTYTEKFLRANAVFDADFNLKSYEVLSYDAGTKVGTPIPDVSEEDAMGRLLFLLGFYFQCIHSLIHIFHVLLVSGLVDSTRDNRNMGPFARQYQENIYLKFVEVKHLLLAPNAGLTGKSHNGDREGILNLMGDVMKLWGECRSAQEFLEKFLLQDSLHVGIETLAKSDILTQFLEHVKILPNFAKAMDDVFRMDGEEYHKSIKALKYFLLNTGANGPHVDNLQTWIELMGITGIIHGATLSATRLLCSHQVLRFFFEEREFFDTKDLDHDKACDGETLKTLLGTIVGIMEEKDVFSNMMQKERANPLTRAVELIYGGQSAQLKLQYFLKIKDTEEFKEFGWIWTDYCPDMIDSKQFTIDTYV